MTRATVHVLYQEVNSMPAILSCGNKQGSHGSHRPQFFPTVILTREVPCCIQHCSEQFAAILSINILRLQSQHSEFQVSMSKHIFPYIFLNKPTLKKYNCKYVSRKEIHGAQGRLVPQQHCLRQSFKCNVFLCWQFPHCSYPSTFHPPFLRTEIEYCLFQYLFFFYQNRTMASLELMMYT